MNQFLTIQNFYKTILEKRAEETASLMPDYTKDSREITLDEVESNKKDQRKELMKLLNSAKTESSADTKTLNKVLPETIDNDTTTSNSLVKIAMNMAFFEGLREISLLKVASADYLKTIYTSFNDETSKISIKEASALGKLTSKTIRATPVPRVNLPAPKVSL